jgi:hypothetical protein
MTDICGFPISSKNNSKGKIFNAKGAKEERKRRNGEQAKASAEAGPSPSAPLRVRMTNHEDDNL